MLFVEVWNTLIDVWRADFTEAAQRRPMPSNARSRSAAIIGLVIALTVRGLVAAYTGREKEARADANAAIEAAERFGGAPASRTGHA